MAKGWGREAEELQLNGYRASTLGDEKVLEIDSVLVRVLQRNRSHRRHIDDRQVDRYR